MGMRSVMTLLISCKASRNFEFLGLQTPTYQKMQNKRSGRRCLGVKYPETHHVQSNPIDESDANKDLDDCTSNVSGFSRMVSGLRLVKSIPEFSRERNQ